MSLSEFHASTIVKVEASFGFAEFACMPDEITDRLGITPDGVRTKGEPHPTPLNPEQRVPFSSWHIESSSSSKDINDHLRQLLARLGAAKGPFDPKWGEPSFGVLWKGNYLYAGSGPFYEPDVIAGVAALGAALYQDIYQVDQDDSEIENKSEFRRIQKP